MERPTNHEQYVTNNTEQPVRLGEHAATLVHRAPALAALVTDKDNAGSTSVATERAQFNEHSDQNGGGY